MANKVDIVNENKRTPIEVLTVEVMKLTSEIKKMNDRLDVMEKMNDRLGEIVDEIKNQMATVSSLVAEMRKYANGNSNNGETRESTLTKIESLLKEILRGLSNVTEQLSLEFTDVKNKIVKHGDNEAELDKCPQTENCTINVILNTIVGNTREIREMVTDIYRGKTTDAETGTGSNPRPEVPERWRDLPGYYCYLLPKYGLIQFFHDRYFRGFLKICAWCAATVFLLFICFVLHDNATLRMEHEKNELIRSYIRKRSEYFDGFIIYVDGLYTDKKAHRLEIDTLKRMYMNENEIMEERPH